MSAAAGTGIAVSQTGALTLGPVSSRTGLVELTATGSINSATPSGTAADITATAITLNALGGTSSIGNAGSGGLRIASPTGGFLALNATAAGTATLSDVSGGVQVGRLSALGGDLALSVVNTTGAGQSLVLGSTSSISATGKATLQAGDSVVAERGAASRRAAW